DGKYVALSASMQGMAERLFRAIGRPDLITDPRFATNTARVENNDILDSIVAEFMQTHTEAENLALFGPAGVTVGPVLDPSELLTDPFVAARECLVELPDRDMGRLPMHNVAMRLSATPGALARPAPELGADNDAVLGALGVTAAARADLRTRGVI
ncbi:MAG: CoA transferase, partial [Acetobacteraceae bacterium]